MPEHHIPRGFLPEDLRDIERQGEVIVAITTEDDGRCLVTTRYRTVDEVETREVTA